MKIARSEKIILILVFVTCIVFPIPGYAQNLNAESTIKVKTIETIISTDSQVESSYPNEFVVSKFQVKKKTSDFISLVLQTGSGKNMVKTPYNLDLNTGRNVLLSDILKESKEYKKVIAEYIEKNYKDENADLYIKESEIEDDKYYLEEDSIVIILSIDSENREFAIPIEKFPR